MSVLFVANFAVSFDLVAATDGARPLAEVHPNS